MTHRITSLDIVIPCYNEADGLAESLRVIDSYVGPLTVSTRFILVDDGSRDATWSVIDNKVREDPSRFVGLKLSRNRGHQTALIAGLDFSDADAAVSMDADLQDDPAILPEMLELAQAGAAVVFGVRCDRTSDSWVKSATARAYYGLMGLMGVPLVRDHADYRLMTRQALEALLSYSEANLFLRGIVTEIGFSTAQVPYKRPARHAGASSYTLAKMFGLAFAGITSFTSMPLRAIAVLGLVSAFVSAGLGLWVLWLALFHHDHIVPGWASTVVPMSLFTTVQLISMAIIGEYLARMYTETKRRPRYHVETVAGSNRPFPPPT